MSRRLLGRRALPVAGLGRLGLTVATPFAARAALASAVAPRRHEPLQARLAWPPSRGDRPTIAGPPP